MMRIERTPGENQDDSRTNSVFLRAGRRYSVLIDLVPAYVSGDAVPSRCHRRKSASGVLRLQSVDSMCRFLSAWAVLNWLRPEIEVDFQPVRECVSKD